MKDSRPNILLIMADQLSAQWLGAYGHPVVQTPHLDALAERGVLFEAAYANCPICAPSRASMCTGRYVGEIGAYDNGTDFASSIRTFMHHLRRAVSLVDLFPTFLEIAGLDDWQEVESLVDGTSLGNLLAGDEVGWKDYALIEYYSEGVCQPMRAAVSDRLKYVYVHRERPQLFDLAKDANELNNCIDNPSYSERLECLKRLVHDGWDADETVARVPEKQRNRRLINEALGNGRSVSWDIAPHFDPARQYVRTEDAQITNVRRRYPRIEPGG